MRQIIPRLIRRHMHTKIKVKQLPTQRVSTIEAIKKTGDFCILVRDAAQDIYDIAFLLPHATRPSAILVKKVANVIRTPQVAENIWNWDGNEQAPTVNPLITSTDSGRPWTGYLFGGRFVAA